MLSGKIGLPEIFVLLFLVLPYFLPTVIAALRKKHSVLAILVLNLLLGWTLIGWVVALIWACTTQDVDRRMASHLLGPPASPILCSSCGKYNAPDARFCSFCGKAVAQQTVST